MNHERVGAVDDAFVESVEIYPGGAFGGVAHAFAYDAERNADVAGCRGPRVTGAVHGQRPVEAYALSQFFEMEVYPVAAVEIAVARGRFGPGEYRQEKRCGR